ncbi:hypothetical protein EYF80_034820 [Liparis tanakae]|uniref:Uncharacterized protein n=1 Tax=Liparis tanakae TaxID=230148 RepID=A0A4Z2GQG3_9TELE|nr:hypothetical protein EYF80_034820 [Liparis tanakae]
MKDASLASRPRRIPAGLRYSGDTKQLELNEFSNRHSTANEVINCKKHQGYSSRATTPGLQHQGYNTRATTPGLQHQGYNTRATAAGLSWVLLQTLVQAHVLQQLSRVQTTEDTDLNGKDAKPALTAPRYEGLYSKCPTEAKPLQASSAAGVRPVLRAPLENSCHLGLSGSCIRRVQFP